MSIVSSLRRRVRQNVHRQLRWSREHLARSELRIVELGSDAEFFAGGLFLECFGQKLPEEPVHYAAFLRERGGDLRCVGYVHVTRRARYGLVGGLCVDDRFRKRGIGEALLRRTLVDVHGLDALFSYTGRSASVSLVLRLGYQRTNHPRLFVKWSETAPAGDRDALMEEVAALGMF